MATTRTTTKTKTKPAKKPTTKPASKPSVKPKATKTVTAKTTSKAPAKTVSKTTTVTPEKPHAGKFVLVALILMTLIAVTIGVVTCVVKSCVQEANTAMIENGKGEEIEATYIALDGYNYSVLVPSDFSALSSAEISDDYGTTEAPDVVFANEDRTVNVALSKPSSNLKNDDVEEYLNAMATILGTSMEVVETKVDKEGDHNIGILTVISELEDEKVYNRMAFFSYDDKLAIISFNCRDSVRDEWEKVGVEIIDSIRF